jgi:hypothetical protein
MKRILIAVLSLVLFTGAAAPADWTYIGAVNVGRPKIGCKIIPLNHVRLALELPNQSSCGFQIHCQS